MYREKLYSAATAEIEDTREMLQANGLEGSDYDVAIVLAVVVVQTKGAVGECLRTLTEEEDRLKTQIAEFERGR